MTKEIIIFIPFWVEKALSRQGLALEACLDYKLIRPILSQEDMSGLLALQDLPAVTRDENVFSRTLLTSWSETADGDQSVELNSTIIPLARSNELKDDLLRRLSKANSETSTIEGGSQQPDVPYKLVDAGRQAIAVVVYSGYPEFVSSPEGEQKAVVDMLKIFYVYLKPYQVSPLPVFKRYLRLLQASLMPAAA